MLGCSPTIQSISFVLSVRLAVGFSTIPWVVSMPTIMQW